MSSPKQAIHAKGQYFTTNDELRRRVFNLTRNRAHVILEPSVGQGDLVQYFKSRDCTAEFDMHEIDDSIVPLPTVVTTNQIQYGDFLAANIDQKYHTIIGNPPYVKTKTGNLYIDFIAKCYTLLEDKGELVFIVPSDFTKLTCASNVINNMMQHGTFTDIVHPNDESLFKDASIDVIVFRYCKDPSLPKRVQMNDQPRNLVNTNGVLTFMEESPVGMSTFSEYFDVFVGLVTGKESVLKNEEHGNIKVLNKKDTEQKYILIREFPTIDTDLNTYMLSHKQTLIDRKMRNFTDKNWFEWGALRNYGRINADMGKTCIYVSNLTRATQVAFVGKVQYFGGSLIMMIPKRNVDIHAVVDYINSDNFKNNYMYAGRFKIGHKQLCNGLFNA